MIKVELVKLNVLALCNPKLEIKTIADASLHRLGVILLQEHRERWRPFFFASQARSKTEK